MGAQRRTKAIYCNNGTFQSTYPVQGTPPPISGRRLKTSSFNPRAPCGAGRKWGGIPTGITQFQSTHPVGARQQRADICGHPLRISIHAPRRARRQMARRSTSLSMDFNPPAPCGAGRLSCYNSSIGKTRIKMQTFRIIAKNSSHENTASKLVPAAVRFFVLAKFVRSKQHSALLYETAVLLFFAVINARMRDDIISSCRQRFSSFLLAALVRSRQRGTSLL